MAIIISHSLTTMNAYYIRLACKHMPLSTLIDESVRQFKSQKSTLIITAMAIIISHSLITLDAYYIRLACKHMPLSTLIDESF